MLVVFDENVPDKLVEGIKAFTEFLDGGDFLNITSVSLLNKLSASDESVLDLVGKDGILISYDKDFKTHKKLKKAIISHNIGVFWIQQPNRPDFFLLAKFILNNWESIADKIINEERPFIYQVKKAGVSRLEL